MPLRLLSLNGKDVSLSQSSDIVKETAPHIISLRYLNTRTLLETFSMQHVTSDRLTLMYQPEMVELIASECIALHELFLNRAEREYLDAMPCPASKLKCVHALVGLFKPSDNTEPLVVVATNLSDVPADCTAYRCALLLELQRYLSRAGGLCDVGKCGNVVVACDLCLAADSHELKNLHRSEAATVETFEATLISGPDPVLSKYPGPRTSLGQDLDYTHSCQYVLVSPYIGFCSEVVGISCSFNDVEASHIEFQVLCSDSFHNCTVVMRKEDEGSDSASSQEVHLTLQPSVKLTEPAKRFRLQWVTDREKATCCPSLKLLGYSHTPIYDVATSGFKMGLRVAASNNTTTEALAPCILLSDSLQLQGCPITAAQGVLSPMLCSIDYRS